MTYTAKLDRAKTHLQELESVTKAFLATNPYREIAQADEQRPGEFVIHFIKNGDLPPQIPVIVGDALYGMRSALDHLAYSLALKHSFVVKDENCMFPIHIKDTSFIVQAPRALAQMSTEAQNLIGDMQPYRAANPAQHPLGILNQLGNIDKHRHLVFGGTVATDTRWSIDLDACRDVDPNSLNIIGAKLRFGPFDNQTEVARLFARITGPNPNVKVDAETTFDVALPKDGPAPGRVIINVLEEIFQHICEVVVPPLKELL